MNQPVQASRVSAIKIALAVIPALLIVSVCVALYLGATADQEESQPVEGEVTVEEMSGYLEKLTGVIGPRRIDTEEGQRAFRQINAMTMGALGPQNLGYEIFKSQKDSANGLLWPTIWIEAGERESDEVVVVAIPLAESGSGPAFGYGFAEYLASLQTDCEVRLVFYPPLVDEAFADWIWARVGREGEKLLGVVKVTGGDPRDRATRFRGPGTGVLADLENSKLWGEDMIIDGETRPIYEVLLVEQGKISRSRHARRLIETFPVVKDLVDRLGR